MAERLPDAFRRRHFRVSAFDLPLDQLDAPDAGGPEFDFPAGAARQELQAADVALEGW